MFNEDFDPLQELRNAQQELFEQGIIIHNLTLAHNQTNKTVLDLAKQAADLAKLIKQQADLIGMLKKEIELLKQ
jgi:hypothetical protein